MDFRFIKTKRGGVMSIHCGKITTTNCLTDDWIEITEDYAKDCLKQCARELKFSSSFEDEVKSRNTLAEKLRAHYSKIEDYSKPYRRTRTTVSSYSTASDDGIKYDGVINIGGEDDSLQDKVETVKEASLEDKRKKVCGDIIKFFSEFTFVPAVRFVNTLSKFKTQKEAKEYISNYMNLTDHPDKNDICEKIKSSEFNNILNELFACRGDTQINKRLEIYYGPAGTGKSTEAMKLYPDASITICNELMDSDSIMKVFDFNDENGNPVFKPSQLQLDMIAGRAHILDEMNLLPLNTLRFLQGVLDSKEKINYEGKDIIIADGFKIIGTMNLIVNGQVFSLPEPIVDRAQILKEYTANEELLANFSF